MKQGSLAALLLLLAATACGDPLATGSFRPAYISVLGKIDRKVDTSALSVYVALLWQNDRGGGSYVARQVRVSDGDPMTFLFRLDVTDLPPSAAVHALPAGAQFDGLDPKMRWAVGTLVVYEDGNGNGQLDFVDAAGERSPDRVLAAADGFGESEDLRVFYLAAGQPAGAAWTGVFPVAPGFSLARQPRPCDPAPGECGDFVGDQHRAELCEPTLPLGESVSAGTDVRLRLAPSDDLQRYACRTFWGPLDYADWYLLPSGQIGDGPEYAYCVGTHCPPDRPPDGQADACSLDGNAYVYKRCWDDPQRCGTRFCHYGHGERRPGEVVSDWPTCSMPALSPPTCR